MVKKYIHPKYAVYMRVSKGELHIENQKYDLDNYIKNRELDIYDYYSDYITGASSTRPDLDRLQRDARENKFNHVLFWKVDRLGRSALHLHQIVEEWKHLGINFTITTLGIDTATPMGELIFGIMAQFAEFERHQIIERTNTALAWRKKQIKEKGYFVKTTADGTKKRIYSLGRPKGSKDKKPRSRRGYYLKERKHV